MKRASPRDSPKYSDRFFLNDLSLNSCRQLSPINNKFCEVSLRYSICWSKLSNGLFEQSNSRAFISLSKSFLLNTFSETRLERIDKYSFVLKELSVLMLFTNSSHQRNFKYRSSGSVTFHAMFASSRLKKYMAAIFLRFSTLRC